MKAASACCQFCGTLTFGVDTFNLPTCSLCGIKAAKQAKEYRAAVRTLGLDATPPEAPAPQDTKPTIQEEIAAFIESRRTHGNAGYTVNEQWRLTTAAKRLGIPLPRIKQRVSGKRL